MTDGVNYTAAFTAATLNRIAANQWNGRVRAIHDSITMAAQAAATVIRIGRIPKGACVLFGALATTVTLGATATLAVGISGTTGKYRAAATLTTVDQPVFFGVTSAIMTELTADETIQILTAAAALPGSGTLRAFMFYMID